MTMTPWQWVGKALATAVLLISAGWLVGGVIGLWSPIAAIGISATASLLVGAPWAVTRIGGAGLAAALMAVLAGVGAGIEGHRAFVVSFVEVKPLQSLTAWEPGSDVEAMQVAPLHHQWRRRAYVSKTVRTYKSNTSQSNQTAVPLAEADGRVVGFFCGTRGSVDGSYAVSLERWNGSAPPLCREAIALATKNVVDAGGVIEAGAAQRTVVVFDSEQALRDGHQLKAAVVLPVSLFALYGLLVVVFRKQGAAPRKT